ncbi:MAG: tetratricopeptide repeat protein, partial [Planctomycetes bacterium]|nr:tetratricopeptide repeat protein [Planctomycetota bacterium]
ELGAQVSERDFQMARLELAIVLSMQGRLGEAEEQYREHLAWAIRELGEENENTLLVRSNLAGVVAQTGRYAEAEEHCARARGKEDLWVDEHRFAAVCARFRRAAEELASVRGSADLRDLPPARLTLVGRLCLRVGRHADAAELLERACAERDRVVPALERELAIAAVLASRSDPAGALRLRGVARAALERALAALNARLRLGSMAAQRTVLMELCRWQWDERLAPVREGPPDWPVQEAKPWRELWGAVARTAAALRMPR